MVVLALLDLSGNRISQVPNDAFATLRLIMLMMADNNITLYENALRGLEKTLKNLNLKGTRLRNIPPGVRNLLLICCHMSDCKIPETPENIVFFHFFLIYSSWSWASSP
jgi:Leucine-rich repeat (LRR) protein